MHADVIVIGAGPTGLACAIEAQKVGLKVISIDKGCLVNSIFHYPANMIFFTTPELLEIGDIPFSSANPKPNRLEALEYYRKVAEHYKLDVRQYQRVETVTGQDKSFRITTCDRLGQVYDYGCRKVIVSTGYYDRANLLRIPGDPGRIVQAQLFSYRSLLTFKLMKESPLAYREGLRLLRLLIPKFAILGIHHEDRPTAGKRSGQRSSINWSRGCERSRK